MLCPHQMTHNVYLLGSGVHLFSGIFNITCKCFPETFIDLRNKVYDNLYLKPGKIYNMIQI